MYHFLVPDYPRDSVYLNEHLMPTIDFAVETHFQTDQHFLRWGMTVSQADFKLLGPNDPCLGLFSTQDLRLLPGFNYIFLIVQVATFLSQLS
jgi:hypothetical protein